LPVATGEWEEPKRRRWSAGGGASDFGDEAGIDGADVVVRLRAGRIGRPGIAKAVARVPEK